MPTTSVAFLQDRVNRVTAFIPAPCAVFFLMQVNSSLSIDEFQMDAMMVSFQRSTPTLNGYYGHDPLAWKLSPGDPEKLKEWETLHQFSVSPNCVVKI